MQTTIDLDVELNFTRFYSDEENPGKTAWATVNMVESGVKQVFDDRNFQYTIIDSFLLNSAVVGDMISTMTEASAAMTGVWQIPQCSFASASLSLTNKHVYPYFFRTVGSVLLYGDSLVNWVSSMGWKSFALVYTNDAVGQQGIQVLYSVRVTVLTSDNFYYSTTNNG